MNTQLIRDKLVEHGKQLFDSQEQLKKAFTNNSKANELLDDLNNRPHAFVLACVMDQQIRAERAWMIPYSLSQRDPRLAEFSITALGGLSLSEVEQLMSTPEPLHRFVKRMSGALHSAIQRICRQYEGDATRIWAGRKSSAEVVYRFLEFHGVGPKVATMAVNILSRRFKIEFADYFSIDISADVHVRRVFCRLGLCPCDASVEQVVYKARALYPTFPGIMDLPCWEIGRNWCKPKDCDLVCRECYMRELCPAARV